LSLEDNQKDANDRVSALPWPLHATFDKGKGQHGHQLEVKIDWLDAADPPVMLAILAALEFIWGHPEVLSFGRAHQDGMVRQPWLPRSQTCKKAPCGA